jgi:hypothetical protein
MGCLGPDNFDNDRGLNYLDDVARPIAAKILALEEYPDLADPDEPHSDETVAAVELLAILCESTSYCPPATRRIELCRDNFVNYRYGAMQDWLQSNDTAKPDPDFVEERRDVIQRTFERLLVQCRKADDDGLIRDE